MMFEFIVKLTSQEAGISTDHPPLRDINQRRGNISIWNVPRQPSRQYSIWSRPRVFNPPHKSDAMDADRPFDRGDDGAAPF